MLLKIIFNNTSNLHTPFFLNWQTLISRILPNISNILPVFHKKTNNKFSKLNIFRTPTLIDFIERWKNLKFELKCSKFYILRKTKQPWQNFGLWHLRGCSSGIASSCYFRPNKVTKHVTSRVSRREFKTK